MRRYDKLGITNDTFYPGKPDAAELVNPELHVHMLQQDLNRSERLYALMKTERDELKSKVARLEREKEKYKRQAKDALAGWNTLMTAVSNPAYLTARLEWIREERKNEIQSVEKR